MKYLSVFFALLFSSAANALSGPPDQLERIWLENMEASANNFFYVSRGPFYKNRLVWLVRDPWEPQPHMGGKSWIQYWGTRHCTDPRYTRPLGCVGGSVSGGVVHILHLPPYIVDEYNRRLSPADQRYRRDRCFYSLERMTRFFLHEGMHAQYGYRHGSQMSRDQSAVQSLFDSIYRDAIRADDAEDCP